MFFTLLILILKDEHIVRISICAGIYFLGEISFVLKQILQQRKESSEQLIRTLEATALDKK